MGFFNAPKFPTVGELTKAKPAPANSNIPAPKTWFNLDLRTVLLVLLAISAALTATQIPFLLNPFYMILFIFGLIGLLVTLFGCVAIYRLIPEWMVAYGYMVLIYLFLDAIWVIGYAIRGGLAGSLIFYAFRVVFTIFLLQCLMALRAYANACAGLGV
ncbi:hypothetical protein HDU67_006576 [Dinochytrium kinnereticum]|nr:hypothetical protein HDU67_006576 [Dinochytrium kinnereticum]